MTQEKQVMYPFFLFLNTRIVIGNFYVYIIVHTVRLQLLE